MNNENKIKLFLVDDDAVYLKLLEIEFLATFRFYLLKHLPQVNFALRIYHISQM